MLGSIFVVAVMIAMVPLGALEARFWIWVINKWENRLDKGTGK